MAMCMCVPECMHTMFVHLVNVGACGARREDGILWNWSLMRWVLRTKARSSAR